MNSPEKSPFGESYTERPLSQTSEIVRRIAGRSDVCHEAGFTPRVFVTKEQPDHQYMALWQLMPESLENPETGAWVQVLVDYSLMKENKIHEEGIMIGIRFPDDVQKPELHHFLTDNQTQAWHEWVDTDVIDFSWRIHEHIPVEEDQDFGMLRFYAGNPFIEDDEESSFLQFDDQWELPFLSHEYAGLSKEEYVMAVMDACARSYPTALAYLRWFNEDQLPGLVVQRDERIRSKPPGFLYELFLKKGCTDVQYSWKIPEQGIEPYVYSVGAEYRLNKGNEYGLEASYRESEGILGNHLAFNAVFPDWMQEIISIHGAEGLIKDFLTTLSVKDALAIFSLGNSGVIADIDISIKTVTEDGNEEQTMGIDFDLSGFSLAELRDAGWSNEAIIDQLLANLGEFHKRFSAFLLKKNN
jgi:hypothetical protein